MTLDELLHYKPDTKPEIVCIIGSNKFFDTMLQVAEQVALQHKIVLLPGVNTKTTEAEMNETIKLQLDVLHLHKIDIATSVIVVNRHGYIGESTKREIEYAKRMKKNIYYLEKGG